MNLFILDQDPYIAAEMHCDKHVIKMTLETAQILSTINGGPYKPTHENHPCVKWAGEYLTNYNWSWQLGKALAKEYTHRFGKEHKSEDIIMSLKLPLVDIQLGSSPFVQCMPEEFTEKPSKAVLAYRRYYVSKDIDFKYTRRNRPWWFNTLPLLEDRNAGVN